MTFYSSPFFRPLLLLLHTCCWFTADSHLVLNGNDITTICLPVCQTSLQDHIPACFRNGCCWEIAPLVGTEHQCRPIRHWMDEEDDGVYVDLFINYIASSCSSWATDGDGLTAAAAALYSLSNIRIDYKLLRCGNNPLITSIHHPSAVDHSMH